ncbi:4761_t:CDS:2, partial [Rhizophagus irregularis]
MAHMGPSSLAFWLFGSKVLILFLATLALWHSVPHFSSKVPVLSSATLALWHFGFTY